MPAQVRVPFEVQYPTVDECELDGHPDSSNGDAEANIEEEIPPVHEAGGNQEQPARQEPEIEIEEEALV